MAKGLTRSAAARVCPGSSPGLRFTMEKYDSWYLEGDQRRELRRVLENLGLRKVPFRRRLVDEDVLVTYKLERIPEGKQTKVSLRYESMEEAIPYVNAIERQQRRAITPSRESTAGLELA